MYNLGNPSRPQRSRLYYQIALQQLQSIVHVCFCDTIIILYILQCNDVYGIKFLNIRSNQCCSSNKNNAILFRMNLRAFELLLGINTIRKARHRLRLAATI